MITFIVVMNYHGEKPDFSQSLEERTIDVGQLLTSAGGSLIGFYRTQGRFDVIAVLEMPDAETMQAFNLANQDSHWTIETMRAFSVEEYPAIWAKADEMLRDAGIL
jgi:uncharacterized protein with GYD domain